MEMIGRGIASTFGTKWINYIKTLKSPSRPLASLTPTTEGEDKVQYRTGGDVKLFR